MALCTVQTRQVLWEVVNVTMHDVTLVPHELMAEVLPIRGHTGRISYPSCVSGWWQVNDNDGGTFSKEGTVGK